MERVFKTLQTKEAVHLLEYVKTYLEQRDSIELLIGCDSQNQGRETVYAIVLGLYTPGKGAHVLFSRFETPREKDTVSRLLNEVWFATEVAEYLRAELGLFHTTIDIDLNPDPKFKSNQALASAVGIVTGMGYKVRHKGNCPMMTYAADDLVKHRKKRRKKETV